MNMARDVDTVTDLADAVRLGVGAATAAAVDRLGGLAALGAWDLPPLQ